MRPIDLARKVYENEPCRRTFDEDLALHRENGVVIDRDDFFAMGRPVPSTARAEDIVNPAFYFDQAECDCWHAYLVAGSVQALFDLVGHWKLEWMSFERKNELRFVKTARLTSHLNAPSAPSTVVTV